MRVPSVHAPRLAHAAALAVALGWAAPARAVPPASAEAELAQADGALEKAVVASRSPGARDRDALAVSALTHYQAAFALTPSWRAAAGAVDASLLRGASAAASSWYWVATDKTDYSDAYLAWQKDALSRVFDGRAAMTFEFSEEPKSLSVDGVAIDHLARITRPLALDPGEHAVTATSAEGNVFSESLRVEAKDVGGRAFHKVRFERVLKAGEEDPLGPVTRRKPSVPDEGTDVLRIVTIVSTVALASGIAVGGGYLLFGRDNPRGLDSAEGAAVVITELTLIGAGTVIALVSD